MYFPKGLLFFGISMSMFLHGLVLANYSMALTKSLLYYEAQRSGKLPRGQRVKWRSDSALSDGRYSGINLSGGYYDAGDNVKYGLPMAYTVTMLAWSVVEYQLQLSNKRELFHTLDAIKWGTDYFIKAHPKPNVFYGEVGDGNSDHQCWQRPEDMTTPRTLYMINSSHPGSDLAGETAAALAAASLAFRRSNSIYAGTLLKHAKQLYSFASSNKGIYHRSIIPAGKFYSSSGYEDELTWAATWLYHATGDQKYVDRMVQAGSGGTRSMFSWDDKYVGAQLLVTKFLIQKKLRDKRLWDYKNKAEEFVCNVIQKGYNNVGRTSAGLLWWTQWNNLQYVTSSMFIATTYSNYLQASRSNLKCARGHVAPSEIISFVHSQVNYILGSNPKHMSYMVGYGPNYPQKVHHRGASIVSINKDHTHVACKEGFVKWLNKNTPNPNVLDGAIVGGPDQSDNYNDHRGNFQQGEAATANTAPLVGVLARLA
ncbi:endoglucanase 13-like [Impatiens glandulifera]|uniref:endoglucanase 13-like n=1 Tax=Impatiens glandulifera TaxID=253017 RepID=UPI001FB0BF11|nr:endoglucanase 13-like [Impatiens glandulifera]